MVQGTTPNGKVMITQGGIHDEEALNIYTDGSSFPGKKRAAGLGVVLMWVDEAGDPQTSEHAPTGYRRTHPTRTLTLSGTSTCSVATSAFGCA